MHASDGRKWLEGALPDAATRHYCFIFDAAAVLFGGGELLWGLFGGAEAAAAGAGAAGLGEAAASTILPDVLVGAAAPAAAGGAEALTLGGAAGAGAGIGASELGSIFGGGADVAGPAATIGEGGLDLFGGGGVPGSPITTGAGGGLPAPGSPINVEPLAGSAVPAAASTGSPAAGVAPVPAGIAPAGTATGVLDPSSSIALGDFSARPEAATDGLFGTGLKIPQGVKDAFQIGGPLVAGAGLVNNLMNRNQPIPGEKQVHQAAGSLTATAGAQANKGMELESFINSGQLPPGLADGLKTATAAAEASIKSQYASRSQSGSSAEAQDIQAAHDRAMNSAAQIALQLLQQGSSMVGQAVNTESLAANIYDSIMRNALAQDDALGKSIGNFAAALAGSGGGNSNTLRITTGG